MATQRWLAARLIASASVLVAAVLATGPSAGAAPGGAPAGGVKPEPKADDTEWLVGRDLGGLYTLAKTIGATRMWSGAITGTSVTGRGVGVAVIDTGVVPVDGLDDPGKVINGPDLSFESQSDQLDYLDTYGHGTHMSGIIAGNTDFVAPSGGSAEPGSTVDSDDGGFQFRGIAPNAHLISIKVGADDGAVDVSQVIAAIDWVVEHHKDPGLNIRVLNLSFGTDSVQSYELDPLAFAVEQAWKHGIVVVVAGGNDGADGTTLNMPAVDPFVIAVGASNTQGTEERSDDTVADFSSVGNDARRVDLVAPGRSVVSLRAPGSHIDEEHPGARVGSHLFRGSGSSQAAAITSGAAALLLEQWPSMSPDKVKFLLERSATPISGGAEQGAGELRLDGIGAVEAKDYSQSFTRATGRGSLEASRGSSHVVDPEDTHVPRKELKGEIDIFGNPWDAEQWANASLHTEAWKGGLWRGTQWSGSGWTGTSWTEKTWATVRWRTDSWAGIPWKGRSWTRNSWDGRSWTGRSWTGRSWTGRSWTGRSWTAL